MAKRRAKNAIFWGAGMLSQVILSPKLPFAMLPLMCLWSE